MCWNCDFAQNIKFERKLNVRTDSHKIQDSSRIGKIYDSFD